MTTKFKPLKKVKDLLKMRLWQRSSAKQKEKAGGVVYCRLKGHLEILLLKDRKGYWSIPQVFCREGESPDQAVRRVIEEKAGLIELKIWQTLGQISTSEQNRFRKKLDNLHLFLVQALVDQGSLKAEKEFKNAIWLPAQEALSKIDYEDVSKIVLLAIGKIKRAQI